MEPSKYQHASLLEEIEKLNIAGAFVILVGKDATPIVLMTGSVKTAIDKYGADDWGDVVKQIIKDAK